MNKDGLYNKLVQEYYDLDDEKQELLRENRAISAKLKLIEEVMIELNDILCKYGNHIYEHFEESEGKK